jgi:hypothetical protein
MKTCAGLAAVAAASTFAVAGNVVPTSYDMLNGETGTYTYWDDSYNGSGSTTTSGDLLTGGLGDLTDGVIATQNWFNTPGPYVGWYANTPTITFNFAGEVQIDSIILHLDDSNGSGGVAAPGSILVEWANGSLLADITDPDSGEPFAFSINALGFTGSELRVTINDGTQPWVFMSEIEFNGVPGPGALSLGALGGLMCMPRRRR